MPGVGVVLARTLPIILLAITGYVSWIVVHPVVTDHFFPSGRKASGIAILVIYFSLFAITVATFVRLLYVTTTDPSYIRPSVKQSEKPLFGQFDNRHGPGIDETKGVSHNHTSVHRFLPVGHSWPAPRLADFTSKDLYMCDEQGLPRWCTTCKIWRPDRARHLRDVNRCSLKADHVCPWVGGVVSENNLKFFVQFNFYVVFYAFFDMVVAIVCLSEADNKNASLNGHRIAMLIMGVFFMMLTLGITVSMAWNTNFNLTTPENITAQSSGRVQLAIRVPQGTTPPAHVKTITYPADVTDEIDQEGVQKLLREASCESLKGPTFAILQTPPRGNPWDLGRWWRNWTQVMGRSPWDFLLPIRRSPHLSWRTYCSGPVKGDDVSTLGVKSPATSFWPTGIDVEALKADAGLRPALNAQEKKRVEARLKRRETLPYWLGGAGAPKKVWAAFWGDRGTRKQNRRKQSEDSDTTTGSSEEKV